MTRHDARDAILAHPLACMHVLLNEYGWASDGSTTRYGRPVWQWSHPDRPRMFFKTRRVATNGAANGGEWRETGSPVVKQPRQSVSGLAAQLARLARLDGGVIAPPGCVRGLLTRLKGAILH